MVRCWWSVVYVLFSNNYFSPCLFNSILARTTLSIIGHCIPFLVYWAKGLFEEAVDLLHISLKQYNGKHSVPLIPYPNGTIRRALPISFPNWCEEFLSYPITQWSGWCRCISICEVLTINPSCDMRKSRALYWSIFLPRAVLGLICVLSLPNLMISVQITLFFSTLVMSMCGQSKLCWNGCSAFVLMLCD